MPDTARLKNFAESAVKELQFADTPPVVIARTLRLIEIRGVARRADHPGPGQ